MTNKQTVNKKKLPKDTEDSIRMHEYLKTSAYETSLKRIRKQLPTSHDKAMSRVIHAKGMDSMLDLIARTLARPKCILGGGIFALLGVSIGIYLAESYGYSYNYLLLFLFFIVGYVVSLLIELVVKFFVRYK